MESDTAPLLGPSDPPTTSRWHFPHISQRYKATFIAYTVICLTGLGAYSTMPAMTSMMEAILCRDVLGPAVYDSADFDRARCKADAVQRELATLRAWQTALESLPALLFSVPYGVLADKRGRRPVMQLAWFGLVLQFVWYYIVFALWPRLPLRAILFGAVITCIGNFSAMGTAMTYTVLADVTPQAERAITYFRLSAILLSTSMVSNPLGGALLLIDPWLPLLLGLGLVIFAGLLLFALPETLHFDQTKDCVPPSLENEPDPNQDPDEVHPDDNDDDVQKHRLYNAVVHWLHTDVYVVWHFILTNTRLVLLMCSFCFLFLGRFVEELFLQYIAKRYGWSWSQAAFLVTFYSAGSVVLCLVILPVLSHVVTNRCGVPALRRDLWIGRSCGLLYMVGALLIATAISPVFMSVGLVVFSLGGGFSPALRSVLNAMVEPHHQAILNSLLAMLEFGGLTVAAPALFAALNKGLELGGPWIGLPFLCAAAMCLLGNLIVFTFRLPADAVDRAAERSQPQEDQERQPLLE